MKDFFVFYSVEFLVIRNTEILKYDDIYSVWRHVVSDEL
mgnify:CR=1 FL=1